MIGVAADPEDAWAVEEFFELFKTAWEVAAPNRKYAAVISAGQPIDHLEAESFLVYGSQPLSIDRLRGVVPGHLGGPSDVEWAERSLPVYGGLALFEVVGGALKCQDRWADCRFAQRGLLIHRIGYDLFGEVRHLLTVGQPASRAATPTLELHIELLRHHLRDSGVTFVEIPPRPAGRDFVCCLTHDIDFFGIRRHGFDRTLAGFVARASLGTLTDFVRGRRPASAVLRNWMALLSLPLVFLGLAPDFWRPFADYAKVESGRRSTFFLVPFKGRPGVAADGSEHSSRAVPYQISEISDQARDVTANGGELAVHGIDAWRDADAGRAELAELTSLTGDRTAGIRMHWLYFDANAARRLEEAGFSYDSTWGYNDAVGYRAGTSQVFRPAGTTTLLELPMSIMDSALFYPERMALTVDVALPLCREIVANARRFGGTLVINWHDRSMAPERLWGKPYEVLLAEVGKNERVWFATAGDAVAWFRWRRSIRFTREESGAITVRASAPPEGLPPAQVTVHRSASGSRTVFGEITFDGYTQVEL